METKNNLSSHNNHKDRKQFVDVQPWAWGMYAKKGKSVKKAKSSKSVNSPKKANTPKNVNTTNNIGKIFYEYLTKL